MPAETPAIDAAVPGVSSKHPANTLARARREGEYRHLVQVLSQCGNNRSKTARMLGISRSALYKKLFAFDIR
jgi:DNA-binding NtrC family response regulator